MCLSGVDFSSNRPGSLSQFVTASKANLSWTVDDKSYIFSNEQYSRVGIKLDSRIPAKGNLVYKN